MTDAERALMIGITEILMDSGPDWKHFNKLQRLSISFLDDAEKRLQDKISGVSDGLARLNRKA